MHKKEKYDELRITEMIEDVEITKRNAGIVLEVDQGPCPVQTTENDLLDDSFNKRNSQGAIVNNIMGCDKQIELKLSIIGEEKAKLSEESFEGGEPLNEQVNKNSNMSTLS